MTEIDANLTSQALNENDELVLSEIDSEIRDMWNIQTEHEKNDIFNQMKERWADFILISSKKY